MKKYKVKVHAYVDYPIKVEGFIEVSAKSESDALDKVNDEILSGTDKSLTEKFKVTRVADDSDELFSEVLGEAQKKRVHSVELEEGGSEVEEAL